MGEGVSRDEKGVTTTLFRSSLGRRGVGEPSAVNRTGDITCFVPFSPSVVWFAVWLAIPLNLWREMAM